MLKKSITFRNDRIDLFTFNDKYVWWQNKKYDFITLNTFEIQINFDWFDQNKIKYDFIIKFIAASIDYSIYTVVGNTEIIQLFASVNLENVLMFYKKKIVSFKCKFFGKV